MSANQDAIRACGPPDMDRILEIVNAAAEAYRGVIPADRWHEPYMPADELAVELADGVAFSGFEDDGRLVGVMGLQHRGEVDLVRHAYTLPDWQGRGIGSKLLEHLRRTSDRPILIGTWKAADWAIRFYERHGFALVDKADVAPLLRAYWDVPDRQIETSVVLAWPPHAHGVTERLRPGDDAVPPSDPGGSR